MFFFHNSFVDIETLGNYLQSAKLYIIPYLNKEQITSGTLAFAMGAGCPVISTPFWHAEELLDDGRGVFVPFNSPDAFTKSVNDLLGDDQKRNTIRLLAYQKGREMTYKEVTNKLFNLIKKIRDDQKHVVKHVEAAKQSYMLLDELPEINTFHIKSLTDDAGMWQHAKYTIPYPDNCILQQYHS